MNGNLRAAYLLYRQRAGSRPLDKDEVIRLGNAGIDATGYELRLKINRRRQTYGEAHCFHRFLLTSLFPLTPLLKPRHEAMLVHVYN